MIKKLIFVGVATLFTANCTLANPDVKGLNIYQDDAMYKYFDAGKDLIDADKVNCQYTNGSPANCETHLSPSFNWPKDSLEVTDKISRSGKLSFKFKNGPGDCGQHGTRPGSFDDCAKDRERSEISMKSLMVGEKDMWFKFSIFIPEDTVFYHPIKYSLWQIHSRKGPVNFQVSVNGRKEIVWSDHINNDWGYGTTNYKILDTSDVKGKWNDFIVHMQFKKNPNKGFVKVYANGELKVNYTGKTENSLSRANYMKFGIYKTYVSRYKGQRSAETVFYDAVGIGDNCKELDLENEGYSCLDIK